MIYVHLADGFEEIEAITIIDVLRRANLETASVSMTGDKSVRGAHDIWVDADILFEKADYERCDMIVLPGGMPGTMNLKAHAGLAGQIKDFALAGKYLAAICAAPLVLNAAGVLTDKNATIYPGMEEHLAGAKPQTDKVVKDGKIITSRGAGTAIEFSLTLVAVFLGQEKADQMRKAMVA